MPAPHATLRVPAARQGPGPIPAALVDAFALSLARIPLAYRLGAMRLGMFTATARR